jgi:hypothetical protein
MATAFAIGMDADLPLPLVVAVRCRVVETLAALEGAGELRIADECDRLAEHPQKRALSGVTR